MTGSQVAGIVGTISGLPEMLLKVAMVLPSGALPDGVHQRGQIQVTAGGKTRSGVRKTMGKSAVVTRQVVRLQALLRLQIRQMETV